MGLRDLVLSVRDRLSPAASPRAAAPPTSPRFVDLSATDARPSAPPAPTELMDIDPAPTASHHVPLSSAAPRPPGHHPAPPPPAGQADPSFGSPLGSRRPYSLPDGRWEIGSDMHTAMVKSSHIMVTKLRGNANYATFKAWHSAVTDWVRANTQTLPNDLGPAALRVVVRLTVDQELHAALEIKGALGAVMAGSLLPQGDTTWAKILNHIREHLGCTPFHLSMALQTMRQDRQPAASYAREFERRAIDAGYQGEQAKPLLVASLNPDTLARLDSYLTMQGGEEFATLETQNERLARVSYRRMLVYLRTGSLPELVAQGIDGIEARPAKRQARVGFADVMTVSSDPAEETRTIYTSPTGNVCAITPIGVQQALEGLTTASAPAAGRSSGTTAKGPRRAPSY